VTRLPVLEITHNFYIVSQKLFTEERFQNIFQYTYIQQDATLHSLFVIGNCSTCFGWYLHQSSGAYTTVSTASGICHTVTATCRYRGRVGTGLSVLWVTYATHSAVGRGRAGRPEHDQQHCYHYSPTVKPESATAVVELLMMGVRTPETC
jgi:hypothetical protein